MIIRNTAIIWWKTATRQITQKVKVFRSCSSGNSEHLQSSPMFVMTYFCHSDAPRQWNSLALLFYSHYRWTKNELASFTLKDITQNDIHVLYEKPVQQHFWWLVLSVAAGKVQRNTACAEYWADLWTCGS